MRLLSQWKHKRLVSLRTNTVPLYKLILVQMAKKYPICNFPCARSKVLNSVLTISERNMFIQKRSYISRNAQLPWLQGTRKCWKTKGPIHCTTIKCWNYRFVVYVQICALVNISQNGNETRPHYVVLRILWKRFYTLKLYVQSINITQYRFKEICNNILV